MIVTCSDVLVGKKSTVGTRMQSLRTFMQFDRNKTPTEIETVILWGRFRSDTNVLTKDIFCNRLEIKSPMVRKKKKKRVIIIFETV